jgi:catechol 2,3-dioxygenase-like lactoylglutathione lyase family enzyme
VLLELRELGVGLVSADAVAAQRFYAEILGFEPQPPKVVEASVERYDLFAGQSRLEILHLCGSPPQVDGGIYAATGIRVLAVFIDDLDAVLASIRRSGKRIADARDLPGRLRIAFARDRDGNMLELIGLPESAGPALRSRIQVGLTVSDVAAARRFYGSALGLPEQPSVAIDAQITRYAFSAAHSTIKFWPSPQPVPRRTGPPPQSIGLRYLRFEVANLDVACRNLEQRGVPLVRSPSSLADGSRSAAISDPDGNWIELMQQA